MNAKRTIPTRPKNQHEVVESGSENHTSEQKVKYLRCGLKFYRVDEEEVTPEVVPEPSGGWRS